MQFCGMPPLIQLHRWEKMMISLVLDFYSLKEKSVIFVVVVIFTIYYYNIFLSENDIVKRKITHDSCVVSTAGPIVPCNN